MDPKEMRAELARILSTMPYGILMGVAKELHDMNARRECRPARHDEGNRPSRYPVRLGRIRSQRR
jgi:hypothetical protein